MFQTELSYILGIIPCITLLIMVYVTDYAQKEPIPLLGRLFFCGMISVLPASAAEIILFAGLKYLEFLPVAAYRFVKYFIIVALVEESIKLATLYLATWDEPHFDFRFDGVVYSCCISLGFAALENIIYLYTRGMDLLPIRSLTAVPIHCILGVYMGYYYGQTKFLNNMKRKKRARRCMLAGFLIATYLHGVYDYTAVLGTPLSKLINILFLIILDTIAICCILYFASHDKQILFRNKKSSHRNK